MTKIAVFSAGSWGTAFSLVLADAGNDVSLWARREAVVEAVNERRENTDYLPGIELPATVVATNDTEKALAAARASFDTGDLAAAKSRLLWVLGKTKEDEVRDIARLRLAAVFLDEKNYAEALKQLEANPVESMAGLFADMKGYILSAQGKRAEARSAYQLALDRSDAGSPYRGIIQIKLDALGDAK